MKQILQCAVAYQTKTFGWSAFTIKSSCSHVVRMQTVVVQIEEWCGDLLTQRLLTAQADAIQNGSGIHHAAECAEQIKEGLWGETDQITTGIDRLVIEMANGAFCRFVDAAFQI